MPVYLLSFIKSFFYQVFPSRSGLFDVYFNICCLELTSDHQISNNRRSCINEKHRIDFEKAVLNVHVPTKQPRHKLLHRVSKIFAWVWVVQNFRHNETGFFCSLSHRRSNKRDHNDNNVHENKPRPILKKQKASVFSFDDNLEKHSVAGKCHCCNSVNENRC